MEVTLEPDLAKRKPLADMIRAATPLVERLFGKNATRLKVIWDSTPGISGESEIHLTVADDLAGQATVDFSADELESPEDAKDRIYRVWSDIVDAALEKKIEYLKANAPTE